MKPERFTVDDAAVGQRLDRFVASRCSEREGMSVTSRAGVQKLVEDGHVTVNGRKIKASLRLKLQDLVEIRVPELRDIGLVGEALPLTVIYEDEDVLVINKAAGMIVHPAAGCNHGTLVNAILNHCPAIAGIGGERRPGIVHRLDKHTSGVMVVAKNDFAMRSLVEQFKARTVQKEYLALVHGSLPGERGEIDRAIGRHQRERKRMSSLHAMGKRRDAVTFWVLEERYSFGMTGRNAARCCLVRVMPRTGRTHQIRVHLADFGYPLIGDRVYGRRHSLASRDETLAGRVARFPRQALHAVKLSFDPVRGGPRMAFTAPLADDLAALIQQLRTQPVIDESLQSSLMRRG